MSDIYKAMTARGVRPDICTFVALFQVFINVIALPTKCFPEILLEYFPKILH